MTAPQFSFLGRLDLPNKIARDSFYADMFERYLGQTSLEYPSLNFTIPDSYEELVKPLLEPSLLPRGYAVAKSYPEEFYMPLYSEDYKNAKMKAFRLPGNWCNDCKEGMSLNWIVSLSDPSFLLFREHLFVMNEVALKVGSLFVMDWGLPHMLHSDRAGAGLLIVQLALTTLTQKDNDRD